MPLDFELRWEYDRPAQAEERFRKMLPAAEASDDREYHIGLLTQIARAQYHQQQFEVAGATLDQAASLLTPDLTTAPIRCLLERGRLLLLTGQRCQAVPLFVKAFERATAASHAYHAVDAANMLAIAAPEPTDRIDWGLRAVTLAEQDPVAHVFLGTIHYNMGITYSRTGCHDQALQALERARAIYLAQNRADGVRIVQWAVAKTWRLAGQPAKALSVLHVLAATGEENGRVQEEIGECLLALGRPEGSRAHFERAYRVLATDPFFAWDDPARMERLRALSGH
jgi:tetratricopeptide (TPR) repeat protein